VSDINGVSAQEMIHHLIQGDLNKEQMAQLARGALRNKIEDLEKALEGYLSDHHRLILRLSLQMVASYDDAIEKLDVEIDRRMEAFREESERLQTIPGVKKKSAERIVAEIGVDMSRFPSDAHLSSWAGASPGNNESAGKRRSGKVTPGNKWLKSTLVEAAWAASRTKKTYMSARYRRLASKRGKKRAALAVGHSILVMAYHIVKEQSTYHELGAEYFDRLNEQRLVKRLASRISSLGYEVELKKLNAAA
jgi:transposase